MTFLIYDPINIDYLLPALRLLIGDTDEVLYSDPLLRLSLVSAVKYLQRRWDNRYLVYNTSLLVSPQPSDVPTGYVAVNLPEGVGYAPSGLSNNDVFRNSFHTFEDTGTLVSQPDEYPILLAATIMMVRAKRTSSVQAFQNWSDGEFSFSNVASARAYEATIQGYQDELDTYFKRRLSSPLRDSFAVWDF